MLFKKRKRPTAVKQGGDTPGAALSATPSLYHISFEMMQKGSITSRGRTKIRQHAVMVGGHIRLVTSGDTVDRETYEALLSAGVIEGPTTDTEESPQEDTDAEVVPEAAAEDESEADESGDAPEVDQEDD